MILPRDFVRRCAASYPDKVAFVDGGLRRTWGQMHERSDRLAAALQAIGIGKGDVVAILAHDHVEAIEHWFACLKIGAVRVGVNWRYAPREMLHLIHDCAAKVLIIQDNCLPLLGEHIDTIRAAGVRLVGLRGAHGLELDYEKLIAGHNARPTLPPLADDDYCGISYTSGTTGLPKGALWTQRSVRECLLHTNLQIGLRHEDVFLSPGSTAGVGIVLNSFGLVNGMRLVLPGGDFKADGWLELLQAERATSSILMPTLLQRVLELYKAGHYDASSLRQIVYGSEPTRPPVIRDWHATFGGEIMQIYGLTESTGGWLSFLRHEDHLRAFAGEPELLTSCGKPALHVDLSIRDADGGHLPVGEVGELWALSDTNIAGYLNRPEENAELFGHDEHGAWLRCNDLGKVDERGYYYLTDRKKFMIISGAFNVFPVVVENVLAEHPAIRECAVVGAPHPEWGEAVVAVVSLRPGTRTSPQELIEFCRGKVGKWEVPKHVEIIDELPKGGTHKIAKHQLREGFRQHPETLPWGPRAG
ncbi:MAG: class I adenylate-forming enzyme family protein [Pseudomonadota bacterium]